MKNSGDELIQGMIGQGLPKKDAGKTGISDKPERRQYRISVRNLVEFILRSGDIRHQSGRVEQEAMLKGARLHRKLQQQMGSTYEAEVSLKLETVFEDMCVLTEGRADGVFLQAGQTWVDEIKGIYTDPDLLEEPVPVHLAQAKCYAHMLCIQRELGEVGIQMTYADLETEQLRRFQEVYTAEELAEWYSHLLEAYHGWLAYRQQWEEKRDASMKGLEFPFPYREGQHRMVQSVYHAIRSRRQIFIQAPTGIGKTMSTVFPAVRAVGEGYGGTIFYLTARTTARTVAQEAFGLLRRDGLLFKVITLTAKEKICPQEKTDCDPETCPYAKGHYDRVNEAVYRLWTTADSYTRDTILDAAMESRVCPFEMSLDLAVWTDAVIADYNYVFDPDASLKRFFAEGSGQDYIYLIDEAHNLVDRGREMYSACLCRESLMQAVRENKTRLPKLARILRRASRQMLTLKKELEETGRACQEIPFPQTLELTLLQLRGHLEALMEDREGSGLPDQLLELYFDVRSFLNVSEDLDDSYCIYTETGEDKRFRLYLFCVYPAARLAVRLRCARSAVFFSATLHPMNYYRELLSSREDDYGLYLRSPFPVRNRLILIGRDVSSRYSRRGREEYGRIARYIAQMTMARRGNYLVFFPSYRMMEEVREVYEEELDTGLYAMISQAQDMKEGDREAFLEAFQENGCLLGFAVLGGIFSEGIDMIGERLVGAIVVGTGLPQISGQREILRACVDRHGRDGFDYAYRYPGMNKVLQAAGRVIRTEKDRGVILLLDERFTQASSRALFPVEWEDRRSCSLGNVRQQLEEFWRRDG